MKQIKLISIILLLALNFFASAQFYSENSGEMIFGFSDVEKAGQSIDSKLRFTVFLHLGQNHHYDFSDNIGFFTGYGLRNIGIITDENNIKIKRRTYSLGIPLALKAGSFRKHFYFYGGGEYEWFFHYKQKQFIDGDKTRQSKWFSDRTKAFNPSVFGGIQFPGGINMKFKYYLNDFLNRDFSGTDFGVPVDYSVFNKVKLYYISLSYNFRKGDIKKIYDPSSRTTRLTSL
jgi:hypothetical protein